MNNFVKMRSLWLLLVMSLSLFSYQTTYATHTLGADITAKCVGPNQYEITLTIYRDCNGTNLSSNQTINWTGSCGTGSVSAPEVSETDITPVCPAAQSSCNIGSGILGVEKHVYRTTMTVPPGCTDITFSKRLCCRNSAITTINTIGERMYLETVIDNSLVPCNNTPEFILDPILFFPVGQPVLLNNFGYDFDGDSLHYSLVDALDNAGIVVSYAPGFSGLQPFGVADPVTIDPLNGTLIFTPTSLHVAVIAVKIEEYRNGVFIGSVTRDINVTVLPSVDLIPNIPALSSTGSLDTAICVGGPFNFDILLTGESNDSITGIISTNIPGLTSSTNIINTDTTILTINWTPTPADVGNNFFYVKAQSDKCPINFIASAGFTLIVDNSPPIVSGVLLDSATCAASNDGGAYYTATNLLPGFNGGWYNLSDVLLTNGDTLLNVPPGSYYTLVNNSGVNTCTAVDTVSIPHNNSSTSVAAFSAAPLIGCSVPHTAFFTDQSTVASTSCGTVWAWTFGDGSVSTLQNPVHNYTTQGVFPVSLTVTDCNISCPITTWDTLRVSTPIANISGPVSVFGCSPLTNNFTDASTSAFGVNSWAWVFGDGGTNTLQNPAYIYQTPGIYSVSLTITDSLGCSNTDLNTNYVQTIGPDVNFGADTTLGCPNTTINFTDSTVFGAPIVQWAWSFGDGTPISNLQNPSHLYTTFGSFNVSLTVSDIDGCTRVFVRNNYIDTRDTIIPSITCPINQTIAVNSSCQVTLSDYTSAVITSDNCDASPTVTQLPVSGTILNNDTTVWLYSTDAKGNVDSCSFMLTLADSTAPSITCPTNQTVAVNGSCQITLSDYIGMAVTLDNCDASPVVTQLPVSGTILSNNTTVWLYSADAAGNVDSCSFLIILADSTAPSITCPINQTVAVGGSCQLALLDYTSTVVTTDNCDANPTVTQFPVAGSTLITDSTIWIYSTDVSGNVDSCSFIVILADSTAPSITCPINQIVSVNSNCQFVIIDYTSMVVTTDNCDANPTVTQFPILGTTLTGNTTVWLYSTDVSGNTDSCSFTVTVIDGTDPVITCPNDITISTDLGLCTSTANIGAATATDNCGSTITTNNAPTSFPLGTASVMWTATDGAGNFATCPQLVTVVDTEAPEVICPLDQVAMLDDNCEFFLPDYGAMSSFTDNCSGALVSVQSPLVGTVFTDKERVSVSLEVTDDAGNTTSCSFDVEIELNPNNPNCGGELVVTTLFTPNDDGKNDTWIIKGLNETCIVMVFNRWGQKVYESSTYKNDWEGISNGNQLPDGDYYYTISCDDGESYKGPLTILRTK